MTPELSRKRKRTNVSYREPSSDDDFSNSDLDGPSRKKKPTRRSTRHHSTSVEPESSTRQSQNLAPPTPFRSVASPRTSRRRGKKRRISYAEESTDENDDEEYGEVDYEPVSAVVKRKSRVEATSRQSGHHRRVERSSKKATWPKKRALGAPFKEKEAPQPIMSTLCIPTDGRKPDMSSLPYHVLLQIFVYASHPLHDENMHATPSISWLVKIAQMCRAFEKPALTALYRNPPIFAARQNRKALVHHMVTPPADARQDYQVMVKRLELDATQMSALTDITSSVTDLASLVSSLPTLKDIDIFDPLDRPPYRERLKRIRRWSYPDELFNSLRQTELRLQSWRWHSAYCDQGLLRVKDIHAEQAFQSIRELSFVKFHVDERRKEDATDPTMEELLASAISVLPNLHLLAFESCTAVNGKLLSMLPSELLSLSITNCINLTSEALSAFLSERGRHLEELVLNHNQSLDLSFLVTLKESCPRLEVLRMDCNYYSTLAMSSDNEPLYDWLLGLDEVPTWPTTLQIIDMEHLRKWGSDSATNFFQSLTDSAAEFPFLRELKISATVDMNWRERADYRRKWAARFDKVFAQRCPQPSPHLASLRAYREWKAKQQDGIDRNDSLLYVGQEVMDKDASGNRADDEDAIESDSDAPLLAKCAHKDERWNPKRLRSRGKSITNYDETSDNENGDEENQSSQDQSSDNNAADSHEKEPSVIQGRCHTLSFRIDNLRPREELYDEGDFLDEERSGDEEWDEDRDEVEEGYAW